MCPRILLIEDDASACAAFEKVLRKAGYAVEAVPRAEEGLTEVARQSFALVLTDFKLPGMSGLEFIRRLRASQPGLPIVLMTAHGTTETAIQATKLGACEYLMKPFEVEELLQLVASLTRQARGPAADEVPGEAAVPLEGLVGQSRVMQAVYKQIGRVAATPVTVLIRGETGTGKELVAQAIHQHGDRAARPFVAVNCAAIPETLLESELFGHERGAFTGAQSQRIGRFEQATGGTLFLDEIGDLHPNTQSKLLRVLQERHVQRLGGDEIVPVDVRVLAATHCDIETAIREKEFREDLFYRLNGVTIQLPALRERREDIPGLIHHFIRRDSEALGVKSATVENDAVALLQEQPWPGNVRELENIIRQVLLVARPFPVNADHVRQVLAQGRKDSPVPGPWLSEYVAALLSRVQQGAEQNAYARLIVDFEPELYAQAIRLAQGNQVRAARWLGVTRLKMREKLKEFDLHPKQEQKSD